MIFSKYRLGFNASVFDSECKYGNLAPKSHAQFNNNFLFMAGFKTQCPCAIYCLIKEEYHDNFLLGSRMLMYLSPAAIRRYWSILL